MSNENDKPKPQVLTLKGNEKRTFTFTEPTIVVCTDGRCSVLHWCKGCERQADMHKSFGSKGPLHHRDVLEPNRNVGMVKVAADEPCDVIAGENGATVVLTIPEAQEEP